jgi:hypothetical protein
LRLAYAELHTTADLAGTGAGWEHAAAAVLRATQAVVTAPVADDAGVGAALDQALAAEGISAPPDWRDEATAMLKAVAAAEHGPYASGYDLQEVAPDDVWVRG